MFQCCFLATTICSCLFVEEEKPTSSVIIEEQSVSFDTSSQNTTSVYEDFYEEEPFDSEFDSDEEFGSRRKKRKSAKMKVQGCLGYFCFKFSKCQF